MSDSERAAEAEGDGGVAPERSAADAIDPRAIGEELAALVAIRSVTGDEAAAIDHVAALLAQSGLGVRRWDADLDAISADPAFPGMEVERSRLPLAAATLHGGRPGPRRMLLGHLDVVPPGDPAAWTGDPFSPRLVDGRLIGRGSCDMKGGVAAILAALRAAAQVTDGGRRLAGDVVALFVPGEEDGGVGALAAIRAGYVADAAIIPEPTRLDVVTVHAGAITFRLTVPGRAAHASTRREGVSAFDKLGVIARALEADERDRNEGETRPELVALGLPYPTIIGRITGGDWASTVPDRMVAEGRYGVRVGTSTADAEGELRAVIERANASDDWLREHPATVEVVGGRFASGEVATDAPLPQGLADVARAVLGRRPSLVGVPYGADMRLLINEGGIPTVMFGPGDVRQAHSADEWVAVDEVADCARVLAAWIVRSGPTT